MPRVFWQRSVDVQRRHGAQTCPERQEGTFPLCRMLWRVRPPFQQAHGRMHCRYATAARGSRTPAQASIDRSPKRNPSTMAASLERSGTDGRHCGRTLVDSGGYGHFLHDPHDLDSTRYELPKYISFPRVSITLSERTYRVSHPPTRFWSSYEDVARIRDGPSGRRAPSLVP